MLIFIDTEFTDFVNTELISIGLVTDDGQHEFYAELNVDINRCSEFVVEEVLPQLGKVPAFSIDETRTHLLFWLHQFESYEDVKICFDFEGDLKLFQQIIGKMPSWLSSQNIYNDIDESRIQYFLKSQGLEEHHALNDAKANRYAYVGSL